MLDMKDAAKQVLDFLQKNGFCPEKASKPPICVDILAKWVEGKLTDEEAVRALRNVEILSKTNLRKEGP